MDKSDVLDLLGAEGEVQEPDTVSENPDSVSVSAEETPVAEPEQVSTDTDKEGGSEEVTTEPEPTPAPVQRVVPEVDRLSQLEEELRKVQSSKDREIAELKAQMEARHKQEQMDAQEAEFNEMMGLLDDDTKSVVTKLAERAAKDALQQNFKEMMRAEFESAQQVTEQQREQEQAALVNFWKEDGEYRLSKNPLHEELIPELQQYMMEHGAEAFEKRNSHFAEEAIEYIRSKKNVIAATSPVEKSKSTATATGSAVSDKGAKTPETKDEILDSF
jgi:hypothetical protein